MTIQYITEPLEQYVTRIKTGDMVYARTTIHCPSCRQPFKKGEFEEHVNKVHGANAEKVFAMLFGLPYPYRCASCGKEIKYSPAKKGFAKMCGSCMTGCNNPTTYKNKEDAHKSVEQLTAMLAHAKAEEKRLAQEEELSRIPLSELPFPTKKDTRLLKRIAMDIRTHAINGDQDKLKELANFIDNNLVTP